MSSFVGVGVGVRVLMRVCVCVCECVCVCVCVCVYSRAVKPLIFGWVYISVRGLKCLHSTIK